MISSAELLLVLAVGVPAQTDTLPPSAQAAVRAALAARWQVPADEIQLEWGRAPAWHDDTSAVVVRLGPAGQGGWQLATLRNAHSGPVAVRVRAGVRANRPVAARSLAAGAVLGAADVEWDDVVVWGDALHESAEEPPIGWQLSRPVAVGQPLEQSLLQPPCVIEAGEPVAFIWQRGEVRLERIAIAQSAARLGEPVRGRAGETQLVGRATGPGVAHLGNEPQ